MTTTTPSLAPQTPEEWEEFHDQLDRLEQACGPKTNRHELARVFAEACIIAGINTAGQIIKVLMQRGFKRGHIGAVLKPGKGGWLRRDEAGVLSLVAG